MRRISGRLITVISGLVSLTVSIPVLAQAKDLQFADTSSARSRNATPMGIEPFDPQDQSGGASKSETKSETTYETKTVSSVYGFKGVNDFFNIREANSDVKACEWEFMIGSNWSTFHSRKHRDDDFTMTPSIKYGITDDLFAEMELLPVNLGDGLNLPNSDGADGTGDIALKLFWQFLHETDCLPAMAIWGEARLPTGENSEKVDGTLNLNLTKTICGPLRAHLQGFVMTANGSRGDWDRIEFGDRRHFQWGVGPGLDYAINECNMIVFNYLNRSSDYYGSHNNNILELGYVYTINECSYLRAAVDVDTHSDADGAHWSAKIQYAYSFGG
ncbi:MAG: hypothetical protein HZA51_14510 [Planctomycetes bacterium]|nr:hypothetical protein [Planctomycetota bacterium]